jgi:uroporphyrinogen decarboxylase
MTKREVVRLVFEGRKPPYVPWDFGFTVEAREKLARHPLTPPSPPWGEGRVRGADDLDRLLGNHLFTEPGIDASQYWTAVGNACQRDYFGVVWDRSVDKDIGVVKGCLLPEPDLSTYKLPHPIPAGLFEGVPERLARHEDRFRVYAIGFSLYERAWTLRGMENLLADFIEHPQFVHDLLSAIADFNIAQVRRAVQFGFDAVYFGDDWGQQRGLQMGPRIWREFIKPQLARMYAAVHAGGKFVAIHSCGDVDELFDELIAVGVNCFNPFQPEVMDVFALLPKYRGRLAFHGGLSTQRTLPYGSAEDVRRETQALLEAGSAGGYIFAPAHAVEGDVPLANMLAFIDEVQSQLKTLGS